MKNRLNENVALLQEAGFTGVDAAGAQVEIDGEQIDRGILEELYPPLLLQVVAAHRGRKLSPEQRALLDAWRAARAGEEVNA